LQILSQKIFEEQKKCHTEVIEADRVHIKTMETIINAEVVTVEEEDTVAEDMVEEDIKKVMEVAVHSQMRILVQCLKVKEVKKEILIQVCNLTSTKRKKFK
jgi:hypothetical protein